jgi:hypothetical protein
VNNPFVHASLKAAARKPAHRLLPRLRCIAGWRYSPS